MTTPDSRPPHPEEPSEGAEQPADGNDGRTPHPDAPAEGADDPAETGE
jgi:hypothetical protein